MVYLFRRPDYRSDVTQFLDKQREDQAALHQHKKVWASKLLPDTALLENQDDAQEKSAVQQSGYVYLNQPFTQV